MTKSTMNELNDGQVGCRRHYGAGVPNYNLITSRVSRRVNAKPFKPSYVPTYSIAGLQRAVGKRCTVQRRSWRINPIFLSPRVRYDIEKKRRFPSRIIKSR